MEYLLLITCLLMAFIGKIFYKDNFNPIFFFSAFWFVILSLSFLRLRGYYEASNHTLFIYLLGIISFCLGGIFLGNKYISLNRCKKEKENTILNNKLFFSICVFVLLYSSIKFMRVLPYFIQGSSIAEIRAMYWSLGSGITINALDYFIDNTINKGLQLAIFVIISAEIARGNKNKWLIIFLIPIVVLTAAISGGRLVFFDLVISIFVAFMISKRKMVISKKMKKTLSVAIAIGIIGMVFLTNQRQGHEGFLMALYGNFTLNVPLMNHVTSVVNLTEDYTYGITFFRGFIEPFTFVLQAVNLIDTPESFSVLSKYTVPFFDIGGGNVANAYTSAFFYFYLDGRYVGVVLGCLIYGLVSINFYNRMKFNMNSMNIAMYLIIIDTIFRTMIRFSFSSPSYILALIVIPIVYKKVSIDGRGENKIGN